MIYNLKKDNYKDFACFKQNTLEPNAYFIPFSTEEKLNSTTIKTERYNSDLVKCLSGEWNFKYYKNREDIPDAFDSSKEIMDTVQVPSTWQHTGYEKPYYVNTRYQFKPNPPKFPEDCPAAVYTKKFNIENNQLNYVITFLGVAGSLDLFCNGKYVGYSEGSHNSASFDLSNFVVMGENEIAVVNHKWCNGTYLECQDMFRDNGIFRDVLLRKSGTSSIDDIEAKTTYMEDGYSLDLLLKVKTDAQYKICAKLSFGDVQVSAVCEQSQDKNVSLHFGKLSVREWSAETPNLYTLLITLENDGKVCEVIRKYIGFKHINIKGNVFYFNNKNIKLLGVNHHDTNPVNGFVMSCDDMEQDVKIFKEYNVNCVRTSHYPPDPMFFDFCDYYGVYVVAEADIETHGCGSELHRPMLISHNPKWQEHYWDRVFRMYCRDKNHPSITMWSLGNEAEGFKNQDYCYNNLKKLTDIPIHYEGVCRTRRWAYDVVSQMYTSQAMVKRIASGNVPKKYLRAPYYLCEYAHAMGVGAGDLEKYIEQFYAGDNMLGGCIWEYVDHAAYQKDGNVKYTYGGDHGEWKHDGNFCVDGLFYPNRTPHAGAYQMKNCYRPVRAKRLDANRYEFFNHKYFTDANLDMKWQLLSDGTVISSGEKALDMAPQSSEEVVLNYNITDRKYCHNVIIFYYYNKNGEEIAFEQIELNSPEIQFVCPKISAPDVEISENKLFINFDNGYMIYNATTGLIEKYEYCHKDLFNPTPLGEKGVTISLFRAPLDNDMYMKKNWLKLGLDHEQFVAKQSSKAASAYDIKGNAVIITNTYAVATTKKREVASFTFKYFIYRTGKVKIKVVCNNARTAINNIPRVGAVIELPKAYNQVKYYGLGPMQSLSDFKLQCHSGIFETSVENMHEDYIKPQESSMRTDTRWAQITDENGFGIHFEAVGKPFTFSADHYSSAMCAKALHREELPHCDTTLVHIDSFLMGAGSNSCGPQPSNEHKLSRLSDAGFEFSFEPIGDKNV